MLKRRSKRRYLAILHAIDFDDNSREEFSILNSIIKRNSELFGHIPTELSSVRLIRSQQKNMIIISCCLEYVDNILSTIALIDPPLVTIVISGTLKRIRRHLQKILGNTYL